MAATERTQVLLSVQQRKRLEREAARRGISVGALIREAIDAYTVPRRHPRAAALEALLGLEAPAPSWDQMKAEINRGATR